MAVVEQHPRTIVLRPFDKSLSFFALTLTERNRFKIYVFRHTVVKNVASRINSGRKDEKQRNGTCATRKNLLYGQHVRLIVVLAYFFLNIVGHMEGQILRTKSSRKQQKMERVDDVDVLSWELLRKYVCSFEKLKISIEHSF